MRVVLDTNIVVSGLFWYGPPRQLLDAARIGMINLFTTAELLAELEDVLQREKFAQRIELASLSVETLILGYATLATVVKPASLAPFVIDDPDDDAVLACAVAAQARIIVSGDRHLLRLHPHNEIQILKADIMLSQIQNL